MVQLNKNNQNRNSIKFYLMLLWDDIKKIPWYNWLLIIVILTLTIIGTMNNTSVGYDKSAVRPAIFDPPSYPFVTW